MLTAGLFIFLRLAAEEKVDIELLTDPCGFKQRYGLPCPTCGITSSAMAFADGRILDSFYIQPAGALFCCILAVSGFFAFPVAVFGVYFRFLERFFAEVKIRFIIFAIIVIIAAGWAVMLARAISDK